MFSTGQLVFTVLFVIAFIAVTTISYKKDKMLHKKNYKGVKWILVSFVLFLTILFAIKYFLNK